MHNNNVRDVDVAERSHTIQKGSAASNYGSPLPGSCWQNWHDNHQWWVIDFAYIQYLLFLSDFMHTYRAAVQDYKGNRPDGCQRQIPRRARLHQPNRDVRRYTVWNRRHILS
jgi:hypothetical protein